MNPILYRLIDPLESVLERFVKTPAPSGVLGPGQRRPIEQDDSGRHRAVVVGYGPVGRTLARLLRENEIEPIVIELNLDTVREVTSGGGRAVYGDATHRDTLEQAGLADAVALVLSSSSMHGSERG